jgi:ABC-type sugar transport system substrate-binding protein
MAKKDAKDVVGGMVEARAIQVANITEAARRFGSKNKTEKTIPVIVIAVDSEKKPDTIRVSNIVTANYDFGQTKED